MKKRIRELENKTDRNNDMIDLYGWGKKKFYLFFLQYQKRIKNINSRTLNSKKLKIIK